MAEELSWREGKEPLSWIGSTLVFLAHAALAAMYGYWITAVAFLFVTLAVGYIGTKKIQDFRVRRRLRREYQLD